VQDGEAQRVVREPLAQHRAAGAELHDADRDRLRPLVARRPHDARARRLVLDARAPGDDAQRVTDLPDDRVADAGREDRRARDGGREHDRHEREDRHVLHRPLPGGCVESSRHGPTIAGRP
jgi:hypothetical protein